MVWLKRVWIACLLAIAGGGPLPLWLHHWQCHCAHNHAAPAVANQSSAGKAKCGAATSCVGWSAALLPFMEGNTIYQQIDARVPIADPLHDKVRLYTVPSPPSLSNPGSRGVLLAAALSGHPGQPSLDQSWTRRMTKAAIMQAEPTCVS